MKYTNKTISVLKVKCVIKDPHKNYWLDANTGHVYDYDTTNMIGIVLKDKTDVLEMVDGKTYVISATVPVNRYISYKEMEYNRYISYKEMEYNKHVCIHQLCRSDRLRKNPRLSLPSPSLPLLILPPLSR